MKKIDNIFRYLCVLATILVVALTVTACPSQGPVTPDPVEPEDTRSEERKAFEESAVEGLYMKGLCVLSYSDDAFQKSINRERLIYRIQSDDQERYMHMEFVKSFPSGLDDGVECMIQYSLGENISTVLIVKLMVVKMDGCAFYLWNEFQKVGVLVDGI